MDAYRSYKNNSNPAPSQDYDPSKEDEEINQLKSQIRGVKQDSLAATRHAVSKLNESEDIASNTLTKLGHQTEKINSIERQMEIADRHADQALDKSAELKTINSSMFSVFSIKNPFSSSKKKAEELERLKKEHEEQIKREDSLRDSNYEAKQRVNQAVNSQTGYRPNQPSSNQPQSNSGQYNFEEDVEGMHIEKEIDSNLDVISSTLGRLKNMSLSMSNELDIQNTKLGSINDNATSVQTKINMGKDRLKTIK